MAYEDIGEVRSSSRVKNVLLYNFLVILLNLWTILALVYAVDDPDSWALLACLIPLGVIDLYLITKLIMLTAKTRRELKERYGIVGDQYGGCAEAIMVSCFPFCAISQMGRHTADYSTFREVPLSATGLPTHLETLVPLTPRRSFDDEDIMEVNTLYSC